jgi:pimeloyl-ACP methyl ester carboxylesterase
MTLSHIERSRLVTTQITQKESTVGNSPGIPTRPFAIAIPQAALDDLRDRLNRTRWPDEITGAGWSYGTNLSYLRELVEYWRTRFDWRSQEAMLNRFAQFRAEIDGIGIHFIHERGHGPAPLPLLLTHGWPDSFIRMQKIIPLLTDPARHGGDPADAFEVIVPSMPGYGFSDRPTEPGITPDRIADLFAELMTPTLGYPRFAAHGGDWGSSVTEHLAYRHAASLVGIHLTDVPYGHLFTISPEKLSEEERAYLEAGRRWQMEEGAYALIQGTRPQTLAYGLSDSPTGLAGWLVEKFRAWSDCAGDVERRFTKDELLTHITLYWLTGTINSANRLYYETQHHRPSYGAERTEVPTGVALFPKDLVSAPRAFGERFFNVRRWTTMPRGGHFAAWEEPELLAADLRTFFRDMRR